MCFLERAILCGALVSTAAVFGQLVGPPEGQPQVTVLKDFVADFDEATVRNAPHAEVNPIARTDNVLVPSIFLHPTGQGDSVVSFADVGVPRAPQGQRVFLLFRIGMSDGIRWHHDPRPNGVRFSVHINDQVVFEEDLAEGGWRARAVPLDRWAGQKVSLALHTNAIDRNLAYDWALFGRPQLVRFLPEADYRRMDSDTVGLAMAEVKCIQTARVVLSVGPPAGDSIEDDARRASTPALLKPGTHWLPVYITQVGEPRLTVESGEAELVWAGLAPWQYRVEPRELALDSPLVVVGRPFDMLLTLENVGEGVYPGGEEVTLRGLGRPLEALGPGVLGAATDRIAPGECKTVRWAGLTARAVGEARVSVAVGPSTRTLALCVRAAEPARPANRPDRPEARATPGEPIRGILATPWSRLCFVAGGDGDDYAIADTWDGRAWQRVGTLYPLARVVLAGGKGRRAETAVRVRDLRAEGDRLTVLAEADSGGAVWPLRITCRPDSDSARIRIDHALTAPEEAGLLAFYGPTILAGDQAYGARKDFALFPGLEFLEGEEQSSSSRDLVPPLNDRRVPVAYKVATPLMAVQGRGSLVALMWDANQEWARGEKYPAARFLAPKPDSGPGYVHMALFAPSVGKYVEENQYEAAKPYQVGIGERLRLSARLVLDHAARYEAGSIVHGPHRGGLVLQALRHWFEAYGLPEPSPQPRDWEAERELSRVAYFETLWNEAPPGWPSHIGDRLQANVTLTASLLLDLQAGVRPEVGAEIRRRIDLVVARSLAEEDTVCRLHSNQPFLQFYYGGLAAALRAYRGMGNSTLAGREQGLWVWRPGDREHRTLGVPGTHTLGQAAYPSLVALSAARYTGDPDLARRAVEALRQMELYDVPRGASMWECPQYQPDLLAASLAVKAYCEAYRLTGEAGHLDHARYWAWTGLPFLYTWEIEGYPTMLYNSIGVIGSTYYTHSWLGRPVVWMGLDYACALQELAEYDDSFPWLRIAQGITNSAQWQQYTEGKSKGCYPDSWEMAENRPNPADINPNLILLNEYRLRGLSLRVRCARLQDAEGQAVFLNSGADIVATTGGPKDGRLDFQVKGVAGSDVYSAVAQVAEPRLVIGCGERVGSDEELGTRTAGWLYDPESRAIIIKHDMGEGAASCGIRW